MSADVFACFINVKQYLYFYTSVLLLFHTVNAHSITENSNPNTQDII